jgi:hypothetical protein
MLYHDMPLMDGTLTVTQLNSLPSITDLALLRAILFLFYLVNLSILDRLRKSRTAACGFLCIVQSRVINPGIYERILGHSDEI